MIAFLYLCLNDLTVLMLVSSVFREFPETYSIYRKSHSSDICGKHNISQVDLFDGLLLKYLFSQSAVVC